MNNRIKKSKNSGVIIGRNNSGDIINGDDNKKNVYGDDVQTIVEGANNGLIIGKIEVILKDNQKEVIDYEIKPGKIAMVFRPVRYISLGISVISFLGLVSSIITIVQSLGKGLGNMNFSYGLVSICIMVFAISFVFTTFLNDLNRKKLISIFPNYIFGFEIGLSEDGKIRRMKISSKCMMPNCKGNLRFHYNVEDGKYYFICSRNSSQHRFEFDFTSLSY